MSGPNLPTNIAATYAGAATDPTAKAHDGHHDALHAFANRFDVDATYGDGQVLMFDAATGLLKPKNLPSGTAADLTGTPLLVSAANGGTGTYPARPATSRPVLFRGTTQPATNGSTSGTGGMVVGLDQYVYWSADGSVLPDSAVSTAKLADGSVTAAKIDPTAAVKLIGDQTVAGVKTYTDGISVPDGTLALSDVAGLVSALAALQDSGAAQQPILYGGTAANLGKVAV